MSGQSSRTAAVVVFVLAVTLAVGVLALGATPGIAGALDDAADGLDHADGGLGAELASVGDGSVGLDEAASLGAAGTVADAPVRQQQGGGFVRGSPDIDAFLSEPAVEPGTESTLSIDLLNTGEMDFGDDLDARVTTARSVRLTAEADDDDPIEVTTDTVAIGDVPTGQVQSVPIGITVPNDAEPGEYDVVVEVRYRYTSSAGVDSSTSHNDRSTRERFDLTVVIQPGARFAVVETDTDTQVGGDGDVHVTMQNVGSEDASDAVVTGTAQGSAVMIGEGGAGDEAYVGDWPAGENRTVTFDSAVAQRFSGGAYVFAANVEYTDPDGFDRQSPTHRAGVTPIPEQEFSVDSLDGTLEVGYSGEITGELSNDGPLPVEDAVLVIEPGTERIHVGERRLALPDMEPGESATFSYDADVSGSAAPGTRQVRFTVEYSAGDAERQATVSDRVEVGPRRPEFDVRATDAVVVAGEIREIAFEITNNRPETLSDVNANVYADSPLTVGDDSAFVDAIGPNETATVRFEVGTDEGAMEKPYPLELDFRYDDERGTDRISDVYQYPIEVVHPEDTDGGSWIPIGVAGLVVVLFAAGGAYWYRSR